MWHHVTSVMSSTYGLCCAGGVLLLTYVVLQWRQRRHLPPGPWAYPILGHMPHMAMHKHQYKLLNQWAQTYGNVFTVYMGSRCVVVLNGWDRVKEALLDKTQHFNDRPNWLYTPKNIFKCKGILWSNGQEWKDLRKFTAVTLRDFGVGKRSLEERTLGEARHLVAAFREQEGASFSPKRGLELVIANIICGIVFGERFEYDDPEYHYLLDMLGYMFKNAGMHIPEDFLPWMRYIPLRSPAAPLIANDNRIEAYVRRRIEEHRETFDPDNIRDYIDLYLRILHQGKTTPSLSDQNIFRVIVDLFLAGSETTCIVLLWTFFYLIEYPDVQLGCQQEIDAVLGTQQEIQWADRERLPFTMATLAEIQRHSNVVPTLPPHAVSQDVEIAGYTLRRGTIVMFNLHSVHTDPKYWESPDEFKPSRWINDEGRFVRRDAFIPFSLGGRSCLGEWLARMEILLTIVPVLQEFTIEAPSDGLMPPLEPDVQAVINHPHPFNMTVRKRH